MGNLRFAIDECEGNLQTIIAIPVNVSERPWHIKECMPTNMKVRVVELDEAIGSFKLVAEL
jgi:hypothetical protein